MQQNGSIIRTGFWSSQTLLHHLSAIVDPPNPNRIKESCYRLSLGHEVYVTENFSSAARRRCSVQKLAPNQCFVIEPGHFALMITLETIRMPPDALGFLSIQTDVKFKGLVNISGFHVDPGFDGTITFAVFNAGPSSVHLRQGDPIFRLWIADLDTTDRMPNNIPLSPKLDIASVNNIATPLESLQGLAKKVESMDNKLAQFKAIVATVLSLFILIPTIAYYAYSIGNDNSSALDTSTPPPRIKQTAPDAISSKAPNETSRNLKSAVSSTTAKGSNKETETTILSVPESPVRQTSSKNPAIP